MEIKNVALNGIIAIARDACINKPRNPQCLLTIFITCRYAGSYTSSFIEKDVFFRFPVKVLKM